MKIYEHKMTLYLADRKKNDFMGIADMNDGGRKVFFDATQEVSFNTKTKVDRNYFLDLISKSRLNSDMPYFIPAIAYKDELFVDPEVWMLSDGKNFVFTKAA